MLNFFNLKWVISFWDVDKLKIFLIKQFLLIKVIMASPGNYYFYIVNRFDSLIYENEFLKANITNPDKKVKIFIHKVPELLFFFSIKLD